MATQDRQLSKLAIIASFPRSGNHLVRHIVERSTGRLTLGSKGNKTDVSIGEQLGFEVSEPPIAQKQHDLIEIGSQPLLLIVRNPKEVLTRHALLNPHLPLDKAKNKYIRLLEAYQAWEDRKLLIYFEDLISEREETVRKICKFFKVCPAYYLENLDSFYNECESYYDKRRGGAYSKGDVNYWQDKKNIKINIRHELLERYTT